MARLVVATVFSALARAQAGDRRGSFLVLGDWGWNPAVHGNIGGRYCQQAIADAMLAEAQRLGDVKFVINVGDSFYSAGVTSKADAKWDQAWRSVYGADLRAVPWYSVYGNHDYHDDPCACSEDSAACAQVSQPPHSPNFFYMPDTSYAVELPELDVEVIAMDMNYYLWPTCPDRCSTDCSRILKSRSDRALELFYQRANQSEAKNLLVFSHYPTDYFKTSFPEFIQALSDDSSHHIEYFGGHRHSVDQESTNSTAPNNNWLVGGGGGWGCDSDKQGFVVGEIAEDGSVATRAVLVPPEACCKGPDRVVA